LDSKRLPATAITLFPTDGGGVPPFSDLTLFQSVESFPIRSGGLRYAATTGYYLTALQAATLRIVLGL